MRQSHLSIMLQPQPLLSKKSRRDSEFRGGGLITVEKEKPRILTWVRKNQTLRGIGRLVKRPVRERLHIDSNNRLIRNTNTIYLKRARMSIAVRKQIELLLI